MGLHDSNASQVAVVRVASVVQQVASQSGGTWLHRWLQMASVKVGHTAKYVDEAPAIASALPTDGDGEGSAAVQHAKQFWSVGDWVQMAWHQESVVCTHVER